MRTGRRSAPRRAGKPRRGNGCRSLRYEALESRQLLSVIPIQVTQGNITVQETRTSYNSSLDEIAVQLTGLQGPAAGSSVIDLQGAWTAIGGTLSLASDAAVAGYNADNGTSSTWLDFTSGPAGSGNLLANYGQTQPLSYVNFSAALDAAANWSRTGSGMNFTSFAGTWYSMSTASYLSAGSKLAVLLVSKGTTAVNFDGVMGFAYGGGSTELVSFSYGTDPPISLGPATLPPGTAAAAYDQTITASGGTGAVTLAVSNLQGAIGGLTVPASGDGSLVISGTPATSGVETFTVTATDSLGETTTENCSITVNPPISLGPATLPPGTAAAAYDQTITASGGTGAVTLAVSNLQGAIGGLTVPASGAGSLVISGTPATSGVESFTVTATDSLGATTTENCSITVNPAISLGPTTLPAGTAAAAYDQTITASGGTGAVTLAVSNLQGAIGGLTVPASGAGSLVISGTPATSGVEAFTVTATDSLGATTTVNYSLSVAAAPPAGPVISQVGVNLTSGYVSWNEADPAGLSGGQLSIDGTALSPSEISGPYAAASGVNYVGIFGTTLSAGPHTYVITATDKLGKLSTLGGSFTVPATIPIQVTQGEITVQETRTSYNSSLDEIAVQLTGLQGPAAGSSVIDLQGAWTAVGGTLSLASDAAVAAYNADTGTSSTWLDFTSGPAGSGNLLADYGQTQPLSYVNFSAALDAAENWGRTGSGMNFTSFAGTWYSMSTASYLSAGSTLAVLLVSKGTTAVDFNGVMGFAYGGGSTELVSFSYGTDPPISLGPADAAAWGTAAAAYDQTITASGGTGPVTLAVSNLQGAIGGLTVPASGDGSLVISGTPATSGVETFTVTATDSLGVTTTENCSITVNPAISLGPATLPPGTAAAAYDQTITASGGTGPVTLAVSNLQGAIGGLTVPASGAGSLVISGTPATSGVESFTVTATDSLGATTTENCSITVNPAISLGPTTLPAGTAAAAYDQTITASGGTGAVTLAVSNLQGAISGLTVPASGDGSLVISGTPATSGVEAFTVTATDSLGATTTVNYSLSVAAAPPAGPVISQVGVNLTSGYVKWNEADPAGLSGGQLSIDGTALSPSEISGPYAAASGVNYVGIFGTTLSAGPHTYVITATDKLGKLSTLGGSFTVPATIPIQVTQGEITVQETRTSYNSSLDEIAVQLTGLQGPAAGSSVIDLQGAWTAVGGTLSLASDAAVAAYNADTGTSSTWLDFTSGPVGRGNMLADYGQTQPLSYVNFNSALDAAENWGRTGSGMNFTSFAGTWYSMSTASYLSAGSTLAVLLVSKGTTAVDFNGVMGFAYGGGSTELVSFSYGTDPPISLGPATLPPGTAAAAYDQTITASGGTGPVTLAVSNLQGAIGGLTVPASGDGSLVISGTPATSGVETFTVTATDSLGVTTTENCSITVNPAISLGPATLPPGTAAAAYDQTITASGGTGPVTLAVSNLQGAIGGLTVPASGDGSLVISGTPATSGVETFTVTATDSLGATTTENCSITVNPAISLGPATLPAGTAAAAYDQTITASGGTGTVTLAVSNLQGAISGLTVPASGDGSLVISGTPATSGVETFTVTATDSLGATTTVNYSLSVAAAPPAGPVISQVGVNLTSGYVSWNEADPAGLSGGQLSIDGTTLSPSKISGPYAAASGVNYVGIFGTTLSAGPHTYVVTATDKLGKLSTLGGSFTVPAAPPAGPVISQVGVNLTSGYVSWNEADPAGLSGGQLSIDGVALSPSKISGPYAAASGVNYVGMFGTTLSAGPHTYVITATDKLGKLSTLDGSFTVPAAPPAGPVISQVGVNLTSGYVSWNEADSAGLSGGQLSIDGTALSQSEISGPYAAASGVNYVGIFGTKLSAGLHSYVITATDKLGHVSQLTGTFSVGTT